MLYANLQFEQAWFVFCGIPYAAGNLAEITFPSGYVFSSDIGGICTNSVGDILTLSNPGYNTSVSSIVFLLSCAASLPDKTQSKVIGLYNLESIPSLFSSLNYKDKSN